MRSKFGAGRTHNFKTWKQKESYDKKFYDLKWQRVNKTFLHYYFHETIETLAKSIYKNLGL